MKDIPFIPLLAGLVLAFTLAMAAIGANDSAEPFPDNVVEKQAPAKPDYRVVAEWSGVALP